MLCKAMETTTRSLHCPHRPSRTSSAPKTDTHHYNLHKVMPSSHRVLQLLLIVAMFSSAHALLGSDDEQAVEFNNEMILRNSDDSKIKSRLETLLKLKQSIKDLMQQRDDLTQQVDTIEGSTIDNTNDKEMVTEKRVFCNGFTGCGGRFRGRWVQQLALEDMRKRMEKAVASKRPFCNTNGCFNGGKRKTDRSGKTFINGKTYFVNDASGRATASESSTKSKRLFCNGYGGCQNMGKRGLLIPLLMGDRPSLDETYLLNKPTKPVFEITLEPTKEKRFFASSYDSKMDDFLSRISR